MPDLNSALGPIASEACSAPEGSPVVRKTKDKTKKVSMQMFLLVQCLPYF